VDASELIAQTDDQTVRTDRRVFNSGYGDDSAVCQAGRAHPVRVCKLKLLVTGLVCVGIGVFVLVACR
jgi:hypothetical protein